MLDILCILRLDRQCAADPPSLLSRAPLTYHTLADTGHLSDLVQTQPHASSVSVEIAADYPVNIVQISPRSFM